MVMSEEVKILIPRTCDKCGKQYGKTNATYHGVELWQSCDCMPDNIAILLNTEKIEGLNPTYLSEPEYLAKLAAGE